MNGVMAFETSLPFHLSVCLLSNLFASYINAVVINLDHLFYSIAR